MKVDHTRIALADAHATQIGAALKAAVHQEESAV